MLADQPSCLLWPLGDIVDGTIASVLKKKYGTIAADKLACVLY
jgi:hypothetical protein